MQAGRYVRSSYSFLDSTPRLGVIIIIIIIIILIIIVTFFTF